MTLLIVMLFLSAPLSPNLRQRSVKLVSKPFKFSLNTQSTASYSLLRLWAYCRATSFLPTPPSPWSAKEQNSLSGSNRYRRLSISWNISVLSKNLLFEGRGRRRHGMTASSESLVVSRARVTWRLSRACFCTCSLACRMEMATP
jgi:hypothetical protein